MRVMDPPREWWLSDTYGGSDPSYDFVMGNLVNGRARISIIHGSFPDSHPDLIVWMETGQWHEWDRQS